MQPLTSEGGERLKGWMSLSLSNPIKSSAVRLQSHMYALHTLRKGFSILICSFTLHLA